MNRDSDHLGNRAHRTLYRQVRTVTPVLSSRAAQHRTPICWREWRFKCDKQPPAVVEFELQHEILKCSPSNTSYFRGKKKTIKTPFPCCLAQNGAFQPQCCLKSLKLLPCRQCRIIWDVAHLWNQAHRTLYQQVKSRHHDACRHRIWISISISVNFFHFFDLQGTWVL